MLLAKIRRGLQVVRKKERKKKQEKGPLKRISAPEAYRSILSLVIAKVAKRVTLRPCSKVNQGDWQGLSAIVIEKRK